jgi:hypothetical protein
VVAFVVAFVFTACGRPVVRTPASGESSTATAMPRDLEKASEFRRLYGLRDDEDWVKAVAADPASAPGEAEFGVPLTPAEVADLRDRAKNRDAVLETIRQYGARHQRDWAGVFVDEAGGGTVVAQFKTNVDDHEKEIRRLVGPIARLEVRQVRWSLSELRTFHEHVLADVGWLPSVDAHYVRSDVYDLFNHVELWISSRNPDAPAAILEHFGGSQWLRVYSDGRGPWDGPRGAFRIRLRDQAGRPVTAEDVTCHIVSDDPSAYLEGDLYPTVEGDCWSESVGATGYSVTVTRAGDTGPRVVAEALFRVYPGDEAIVELTLRP